MKLVASLSSSTTRTDFVKEVMKLPGGDKILDCIQCGLCAGSCPTRFSMDYSPVQLIKMIQLGMREDVLSSKTIWACATCQTCATRCPRNLDLTTLMLSLRNLAIKEDLADKRGVKPKFHKAFFDIVRKSGRLHEPTLQVRIIKKSDPKALARAAKLGLRLARKGKIRLRREKIEHTTDLSKMFEVTNEGDTE